MLRTKEYLPLDRQAFGVSVDVARKSRKASNQDVSSRHSEGTQSTAPVLTL